MSKYKLPFKLKPFVIENEFQTWILRIPLIDDEALKKTNGYTLGFDHCTHCGAFQSYAYKLPPIETPISKEAHNEWVDFHMAHAHGDGRVALFERKP